MMSEAAKEGNEIIKNSINFKLSLAREKKEAFGDISSTESTSPLINFPRLKIPVSGT